MALERLTEVERKNIEEQILAKLVHGKLPCAVAFDLAEEMKISRRELGELLNALKFKVSGCQLGCFR